MTLLTNLPDVFYNINPTSTNPKMILSKNFWRRAEILANYKASISLFDEYIVQNGETPESIATNLYDNPFYGWTILLANDIVNYHDQWARSASALNEYVMSKYTNPYAVKQYETTEVTDESGKVLLKAGLVVPSTYTLSYTTQAGFPITVSPITSITYYQYEERLNDEKEKIQLIKTDLIEDFVDAYYAVLRRAGGVQLAITTDDVKL